MAGFFAACVRPNQLRDAMPPNKSIDLGRCELAIPAMLCTRGEGLKKYIKQMKIKSIAVATSALLGAFFVFGSPSQARPYVYTSTYSYGMPLKTCTDGAKKALRAYGFSTFDEDKSTLKYRVGRVSSNHNSESVQVTVLCNQKMGITTLAIAGLDNRFTYDLYMKLHEAEW